jgi:hypothetical protein
MASVFEELLIDIKTVGVGLAGGEMSKLKGEITGTEVAAGRAAKAHRGLGTALGGLRSMAGTTAGLIGATGLAGGLEESVKSAITFQRAQAQLGNAIHKNIRMQLPHATEEMSHYADSLSLKGGFDPYQNVEAMAQFVRITHSQTKAQRDLSLATDISRGTNRSFESATRAVMMVENGRASSLRRLGIALPQVTTVEDRLRDSGIKTDSAMRAAAKQEDMRLTRTKAMTLLLHRFAGATDSYGNTAQGAMSKFRASFEVLGQQVGKVLLPILTKLFGALAHFVRQMMDGQGAGGAFVRALKTMWGVLKDVWGVLKDIWPVLAGVVLAWKAWQTVMLITKAIGIASALWGTLSAVVALIPAITSAADAMTLLDMAMDANPIGVVVVAIGALIGAMYLAYKHCKWFRDIVNSVWGALKAAGAWLKNAFVAIIHFVIQHWKLFVAAIPFIGIPILFVIKHFQWLKTAAINVFHWVEGAARWLFSRLSDIFSTIWTVISTPFKWLWGRVVSPIAHWIVGAIEWVWHKIKPILDAMLGPIKTVGHFVGGLVNTAGNVLGAVGGFLGLQGGGVTPYSGTFMVGEHGPELVTLPKGAMVTPNNELAGGGPSLAGSDRPIIIYNVLDGKQISKSVIRQGLLAQSRM